MFLARYAVYERFPDEMPEHFGHFDMDHLPWVGEVIQLKWLDGTPAYEVVVSHVDGDRIDVVRHDEEK